MNESEFKTLRETAWRRRLTAAEEAELAAHVAGQPSAQADWDDDAALTQALRQLPNVPVASNFTAQVLQAIERDERAAERATTSRSGVPGWLRWFTRRMAWGTAFGLAIVAGLVQFQRIMASRDITRQLEPVAVTMASLPTPEILQDFEEINRLRQVAYVSDEALIDFMR